MIPQSCCFKLNHENIKLQVLKFYDSIKTKYTNEILELTQGAFYNFEGDINFSC